MLAKLDLKSPKPDLSVVIYRGGIFASLRCAREAKIPSLYITKKYFFLLQPLKFF